MSEEDREALAELCVSPGFSPLMKLMIDALSSMQTEVVTMTVDYADKDTLFMKKVQADGAGRFVSLLSGLLNEYKKGETTDAGK